MTLEEIAKLAGVSRSTVSRVVNGSPYVSDDVRLRVQQVIQEQHYHPNAAARSLASRRTRIIGLLIPREIESVLSDPFFLYLIRGAVEGCNEADYLLSMLIESSDTSLSERAVYERVIRGHHVDGVIIASSVVEDPIVEQLQQDRFPFVLVGRNPRHNVSFVDVDNVNAAKQAVTHLIEHGYRRIGIITGPNNMIASIDRYAGFVLALQAAGLPVDATLHVDGSFSRRGGYRAMQQLLSLQRPPEAVFVASDTMASGALQALRDGGLSAPADVAMFGFDGLEGELISRPVLSTVIQPIPRLGHEAVELLIQHIDDPDREPDHRFLPTTMELRTTCGCEMPLLPAAQADGKGGAPI